MAKIIIWLVASVICAIFYRAGGKGGFKGAKLLRRLGCSLLALGLYLSLTGFSLRLVGLYLAFLGLNYGAISTYHDWITGGDENWFCWLITGLVYGLAAFPLLWCGVHWLPLVIRSVALAITIMVWSEIFSNATIEELGRGFLYMASIPILLI